MARAQSEPPSDVRDRRPDLVALAQCTVRPSFEFMRTLPDIDQLRRRKGNSTYFRFLDQPKDIRLLIYEELVVVGKIFYSPRASEIKAGRRSADYWRYQKPDLAILRACKETHKEGEAIYLSKNTFVLPLQSHVYGPLFYSAVATRNDRYLFSKNAFSLVTKICITADGSRSQIQEDYCEYWSGSMSPFQSYQSSEDRRNDVHQETGAEWAWSNTQFFCEKFKKIVYLQMDFSNAFCSMGCCRLFPEQLSRWLINLKPKTLEVIGLRNRVETKKFIIDASGSGAIFDEDELKFYEDWLKRKYKLRFGEQVDPRLEEIED